MDGEFPVSRWSHSFCVFVVLFAALDLPFAVRCEEAGADKQYLSGLYAKLVWNEGVPNPDETHIEIDLDRVHRMVKSNKDFVWEGCTVLCAVKEPSQLPFLVELLSHEENRTFFSTESGLAKYLAAQVRTDEDIRKLDPLLKNPKLFPELLFAIRNTTRKEDVQRTLDPKITVADTHDVVVFIQYRLDHSLPAGTPEEQERFLKAAVLQPERDTANREAAQLAARLHQPWVAEWLIKNVKKVRDNKASQESDRLFDLNELLACLSDATGQDFGRKHPDSAEEFKTEAARADILSRVDRCLAWWSKASSDSKYLIGGK